MLQRVNSGMRPDTTLVWLVFVAYSFFRLARVFALLVAPPGSELHDSLSTEAPVIMVYQMLLIGLTVRSLLIANRPLLRALPRDAAERERVEGTLRDSEEKFGPVLRTLAYAITLSRVSDPHERI